MKKLILASIAVALAITGFKSERAATAADAMPSILGMTKEQVLACLGPPAKTKTMGESEDWTYGSGSAAGQACGTAVVTGKGIDHQKFCIYSVGFSGGVVESFAAEPCVP